MIESAPSMARSFSLVVRRMTMVFLATAVFGTLALYLMSTVMFGVSRHTQDMTVSTSDCGGIKVSCETMADRLLSRAIAAQERGGLKCTAAPSLVDVVLFQYESDQHVEPLTFDAALAASGQKLGWVQRYCH